MINIGHGDPTMFASWWKSQNILPVIDTTDITLYEYNETNYPSHIIHQFHSLFSTDCPTSSIVFGNGSTQVINSILYAISKLLARQILVYYKPPVYMLMHEYLCNSPWVIVTHIPTSNIDVEIIIDPNNPSGEHRSSSSNAKYYIYDRAYNWPIYTNTLSPTSDHPNIITVYTLSKCLGMGGLRVGWAFVNDKSLYEEISRALVCIGICPNIFGLRSMSLVIEKLIHNPDLLHNYIYHFRNLLSYRRSQLLLCKQFIVTNSSGPYAWISSHDNSDISNTLSKYNVKVYSGSLFGDSSSHARLSLICSDSEFNTALNYLLSDPIHL